MIGLGLPWVLYTAASGFQPYSGLKDDGILESIIILALVLAIFIVFMIISGFVIREWHGHVFVVLYASYITYAVARVYLV
jgi:multisubunit Na+/H+ antiporter MnhG subunit